MTTITVTLAGVPQGKGRPRFRRVTPKSGAAPFVTTYTPKRTADYEDDLRVMARAAMRGKRIIEGPVAVEVTARLPIPKSWSIKKRDAAERGQIHPTVKPDWENIAKCLDAFNAIVWVDDKQVVVGAVRKMYHAEPALIVKVTEVTDL